MAINDISAASGNLSDPIFGAIKAAASATGVDFSFLFQQAKIESGLNSQAKAGTSSASGLFQFTRDTWLKVVEQHGNDMGLSNEASTLKSGTATAADRQRILDMRTNPDISSRMAASYAIDNARALQVQGHKVTGPTDLYLAHFLGSGGAAKFLTAMKENPNAPAASILPAAANANKTIFYSGGAPTSLGDIYQRFAKHFDSSAPASKKSVQVAALALENPVSERRALTVNALVQHLKAPETMAAIKQKLPDQGVAKALQAPSTPTALVARKPLNPTAPTMPTQTATPVEAASTQAANDDASPVSIDSLAKFLDSASKWSADPGKMEEQAQKGVASRDASEGLYHNTL